jgi:hypothetical protein
LPASALSTDEIAQMPYTIASRPQTMINPKAVMKSSIVLLDCRGKSGAGPYPAECGADMPKSGRRRNAGYRRGRA